MRNPTDTLLKRYYSLRCCIPGVSRVLDRAKLRTRFVGDFCTVAGTINLEYRSGIIDVEPFKLLDPSIVSCYRGHWVLRREAQKGAILTETKHNRGGIRAELRRRFCGRCSKNVHGSKNLIARYLRVCRNRKWVHPLSGRMPADFTTFYDFLPSFNSCTGSFEYFELAATQWIGTWETTDEVCPALE